MIVRRIIRAWLYLRGRIDTLGYEDSYENSYDNNQGNGFIELELPEAVYNYAKRMSKITGLPLEEVLQSEPVKKYLEKYQRKVKVRLPKN